MAYGVSNPYTATTHPYPTRYHGGIWTRPVFGMPYQRAVQSVFKPTDFNDGNPGLRGMGEVLFDAYDGVFGTPKDGGGVFGPSLYGLGQDCTLPDACVKAKASAVKEGDDAGKGVQRIVGTLEIKGNQGNLVARADAAGEGSTPVAHMPIA